MKLVTLNQGTDAWKAWRRDGIGGSDAATILGVTPFDDATRENLFREKVEGWERPTTFPMRQGNRKEPEARFAYEQLTKCPAPPACVEHEQAPWMRVSLDGLCRHRYDAGLGLPWVLELKYPNWAAHSTALAGEVPAYYVPQCQWQLLVTGLDLLHYVSFSENQRFGEADRLAVVPVGPDAGLQATLLEECGRFWAEVLEKREKRRAELRGRVSRAGAAGGSGGG